MYNYEIKITGIDNNKTKSIWIPFNNNINETSEKLFSTTLDGFIRKKTDNVINNINLNIKDKIVDKKSFILDNNSNINTINSLIDIFNIYNEIFNIKNICICGNQNFLTIIKEKYDLNLQNLFKNINYKEIPDIFHIKNEYNIDGSINYNISINKKKNKFYDYDLVIVDEVVLQDNIYHIYLENNLLNTTNCIILRNIYQVYNKLNNDIDIIKLDNDTETINNLITNEISNISNYDNNTFKEKIKNLLANCENININNNLDEFNNFYYTNKENNIMIDINNKYIKEKLKKNDEIIYKINNQYTLDKIKTINIKKIKLDIINYKDLIDINKSKKITLTKLNNKCKKKINIYNEKDKEYISQEYLNYIMQNIEIEDNLNNIFKLINNINNVKTYILKTYSNLNIYTLNNKEYEEFLNNIEKVNKEIYVLYEKINKKKNNKSYTKYIIEGLQELINIKRKQLFTEVYEKNYFISNFDYSKNDYKCINKFITYNIDNIYINLSNILNNDNINNINKLTFIYNCFNIYSKNKILYLSNNYKVI